jgi:hypothetical protein
MYLILFALLAQTPEQEVENLEHDSYVVRDLASEKLLKFGAAARPALEKAISSETPEVKLRAKKILDSLNIEAIWDSSKVTYVGDYNASDLEKSFNLTGNEIKLNETISQQVEVKKLYPKFNYQAVPFWVALDDFCSKTDSFYSDFNGNHNSSFFVGYVKRPKAYSGSFKATLLSSMRRFYEEYDYHDNRSEITHDFKFRLQTEWECHAKILAYKNPRVIAVEVDGRNYAVGPKENSWNSINGMGRNIGADIAIRPLPSSAKKIDFLHIKWGFFASTGTRTFDVNVEKGIAEDNNLEARIVKLTVDSGKVYTLEMEILSNYLLENPNGFDKIISIKMFDKENNELPPHSQIFGVEEGFLKFSGKFLEKETTKPYRLEVTYDSLYSKRELDFIFKDVAFPNKSW